MCQTCLKRIHFCFLFLYAVVEDIVVVGHQLVDGALWSQLYDAVSHSVYKLVVVRCKENVALERYKVVVESLY